MFRSGGGGAIPAGVDGTDGSLSLSESLSESEPYIKFDVWSYSQIKMQQLPLVEVSSEEVFSSFFMFASLLDGAVRGGLSGF